MLPETLNSHQPCTPACLVRAAGGFNKRYVDETGALWRQVDGAVGVTWADYGAARAALAQRRGCGCAAAAR